MRKGSIKLYCSYCEKETLQETGTTEHTVFFKCKICKHETHVKKSLLDDEGDIDID